MERYQDNLLNYPFTIRIQSSHKKGGSEKKRLLCEDIFTFDIETTSFFYDTDKIPFLYQPGKDPDYWCGIGAGALPYIWQFGINNKYYYGRDIGDFYKLLDDFPSDLQIRIAVHNLSFEWHFLDKLTWSSLFAKSPHQPIKCKCSEYPNIEFYCTLALENMSLASWGKQVGLPKLVGALDYNKMRTPLTPLTDLELSYAQRDLEVMYLGLQEELKTYESVWKLPLTSTGKIRRVCKEMLLKDEKYKNFIKKLVPENAYQYKTSMKVYAGGYTHANRVFAGHTVYNEDGLHGGHYDYTSSYPREMLNKLPCTTWAWYGKTMPDVSTFEDHAYKMQLRFINIRCEIRNTYIQYAHTQCVNADVDNGRLLRADSCLMWCTEQDYDIIRQTYSYTDIEIIEVWEAKKDYMPLAFVQYVLELFHNKTAYKNVLGKEDAYRAAKAFLNSLYGMCVTALLQSEVKWNAEDEIWHTERITEEKIIEHLDKLRLWKDSRYFLNYDWGVWISNGARYRLWNELIIPYDKHVIYADTDSIFTDIKIDFTEYNNGVNRKVEAICAERGLDVELTRPKAPDGKRSYLGNLTTEEEWTEFRTLRAKCYCERWKCDGKLHLTISGVPKDAVELLHDDIEELRDGKVFDRDEMNDLDDVSKLLHTYIDSMPVITFPDGYVSHQKRGVNLRPNGYKIKLDPTYEQMLDDINSGIRNEQFENHLKGIWYDDVEEIVNFYNERSYLK